MGTEGRDIMERLTFEGLFCDIAQCSETPGGSFCEDGMCSQRRVWEQLKAYEDTWFEPTEEVLEAIDELMEFARSRMDYITWARLADVLGAWRGAQKEE
jgi:hypothetical protein